MRVCVDLSACMRASLATPCVIIVHFVTSDVAVTLWDQGQRYRYAKLPFIFKISFFFKTDKDINKTAPPPLNSGRNDKVSNP